MSTKDAPAKNAPNPEPTEEQRAAAGRALVGPAGPEGVSLVDPSPEEADRLTGFRDDLIGIRDDIDEMTKDSGETGVVGKALTVASIGVRSAIDRVDILLMAHEQRTRDLEAQKHPEDQTKAIKEKQEAQAR